MDNFVKIAEAASYCLDSEKDCCDCPLRDKINCEKYLRTNVIFALGIAAGVMKEGEKDDILASSQRE